MKKNLTVVENLNRARKIAHKTQKKNGHYDLMAKLSVAARSKKNK